MPANRPLQSAQPPGFHASRDRLLDLHWQVHRSHPPRDQYRVHEIAGRDINDASAFRDQTLADVWHYGRAWAENPGAYLVVREDRVLYAGHLSTWLKDRLETHRTISLSLSRSPLMSRREALRAKSVIVLIDTDLVMFYECWDKVTAESFEDDLIRLFTPPFNHRNAVAW